MKNPEKKIDRERSDCQFVVKMLSKPEMSTNFGKMSTSKVRKKPDFSGFFDGSGDWIRTNDRSGMNRLLWPTELHRHSEVIISSGDAAVKRFWQKTWGGGDSPIDGSESQIVHLRRGPGAGTVEVWRGPCRQPHSGRVRPSIWWNPAIASGKPRCGGGAGGCTPSGSPTRAGASGSEGTGSIPPGTWRRPGCSGGRRSASPSAPATGTTCRCGSAENNCR